MILTSANGLLETNCLWMLPRPRACYSAASIDVTKTQAETWRQTDLKLNVWKNTSILVFSSGLTFADHIDYTSKKVLQRLGWLSRSRRFVTHQTSLKIYKSWTAPLFNYCDTIYISISLKLPTAATSLAKQGLWNYPPDSLALMKCIWSSIWPPFHYRPTSPYKATFLSLTGEIRSL